MAEHSAVNRRVVGSSPTWGAIPPIIGRFFLCLFAYKPTNQPEASFRLVLCHLFGFLFGSCFFDRLGSGGKNLYPIYPEIHRKWGERARKAGKIFGLLGTVAGVIMLVGVIIWGEGLFLLGFVLSFVFSGLWLSCMGAKNTYVWVKIDEDAIRIVDEAGQVLRSSEYRYVRHMEIRELRLSLDPQETGHSSYDVYRADPAVKLIMVYIDGAYCFEDLKLAELRACFSKEISYWCDKVLFHHNCIAFAYDEEAWRLLQGYVFAAQPSID